MGLFMCALIRYSGLGFLLLLFVFCCCCCFFGFFLLFVCVCVCLLLGFFLLLSWMFQHDCLDVCCFECLYVCFVFFYLPLFSAIEHASHGKAL